MTNILEPLKIEIRQFIEESIQRAFEKYSPSIESEEKKKYYTKKESAQYLNCSVPMIDKLLRQGKQNKCKEGAKVVISKDDLDNLLSNKKG
jgi:excisionase family DNA binding protein